MTVVIAKDKSLAYRYCALPKSDVTQILCAINSGDAKAAGELLPLLYDELRKLAGQRMSNESHDHTLQATALVHEAYLRLVGENDPGWQNRAHFFAAAAEAMRRILVDHARAKLADKRGGDWQRIPFEAAGNLAAAAPDDLLLLDETLAELAARDPISAKLVELRYFAEPVGGRSRGGSRRLRRNRLPPLVVRAGVALFPNRPSPPGAKVAKKRENLDLLRIRTAQFRIACRGDKDQAAMTTDFQQVRSIFMTALERPADVLEGYLAEACGQDAALRGQVQILLAAHRSGRGILDEATIAGPPSEHAGTIIADRYKLMERIGQGGMGSVWLAQQSEPIKRKVAVKLIKLGMDSRRVLGRFQAERQALAMMDHPNIAKVLDGGLTADGRPFFVMELVKGTPITEYCDACKLSRQATPRAVHPRLPCHSARPPERDHPSRH